MKIMFCAAFVRILFVFEVGASVVGYFLCPFAGLSFVGKNIRGAKKQMRDVIAAVPFR